MYRRAAGASGLGFAGNGALLAGPGTGRREPAAATRGAAKAARGPTGARGDKPGRPGSDGFGPGGRTRRRRAGRWRIALFGMLVLAIVAGGGWTLFGSSLLAVRQVQVVGGNRLVPAAEVRGAAAIKLGTPLATVNTTAAADRVEQIAAVLSARVSRSWPNTIVITIRDRTPALAVASAGGYELIDASGVTVRSASRKPAGMPLLTDAPATLRGNPAVRAAVTVLRQLPGGLRSQVIFVSAPTASAVTLRLRDGITVLWGGPGQAGHKAGELALLMRTHARYYDVSDPNTVVTKG